MDNGLSVGELHFPTNATEGATVRLVALFCAPEMSVEQHESFRQALQDLEIVHMNMKDHAAHVRELTLDIVAFRGAIIVSALRVKKALLQTWGAVVFPKAHPAQSDVAHAVNRSLEGLRFKLEPDKEPAPKAFATREAVLCGIAGRAAHALLKHLALEKKPLRRKKQDPKQRRLV